MATRALLKGSKAVMQKRIGKEYLEQIWERSMDPPMHRIKMCDYALKTLVDPGMGKRYPEQIRVRSMDLPPMHHIEEWDDMWVGGD